MQIPPSDERREILQPSLLPVPDNSGPGVPTTSDHNRVSNGVRDGTGDAVNNNVTTHVVRSLSNKNKFAQKRDQ